METQYLKSGMPLAVLMPAPTMTTTFWHALVWISLAMSSRDSFSSFLSPPLPKKLEARADEQMNFRPPETLTEKRM